MTIYILNKEGKKKITYAISNAIEKTYINLSHFEIYDKSKSGLCNRLIVVKPFNWTILSRFGEVFILDEGEHECVETTTRAVKVTGVNNAILTNVCVGSLYSDILDTFQHADTIQIDYDLPSSSKFTILDALNILSQQGYLHVADTNITLQREKRNIKNDSYVSEEEVRNVTLMVYEVLQKKRIKSSLYDFDLDDVEEALVRDVEYTTQRMV